MAKKCGGNGSAKGTERNSKHNAKLQFSVSNSAFVIWRDKLRSLKPNRSLFHFYLFDLIFWAEERARVVDRTGLN